MVVPLKKQRTGKFFKPWDNPDEMNLEEVTLKDQLVKNMTHKIIFQVSSYCTQLLNMAYITVCTYHTFPFSKLEK